MYRVQNKHIYRYQDKSKASPRIVPTMHQYDEFTYEKSAQQKFHPRPCSPWQKCACVWLRQRQHIYSTRQERVNREKDNDKNMVIIGFKNVHCSGTRAQLTSSLRFRRRAGPSPSRSCCQLSRWLCSHPRSFSTPSPSFYTC